MEKEEYDSLFSWLMVLSGIIIGIGISIMIIDLVSAEELNGTTIINNTYIINNTINNTYYINQTINQSFVTNYTINATVTQFVNQTINDSCINCSYYYNITNITYVNYTYINVTYNESIISLYDLYNKSEVDTKINSVNEKFNNYVTKDEVIKKEWRNLDTYIVGGILILICICIVMVYLVFKTTGGYNE